MKFLVRLYMMGFRNADRAKFVEWVEKEHYRLCRIENEINARKRVINNTTHHD